MSKIVKAINSMIVNSDKIGEVFSSPYVETSTELFFEYNKKYVWSVMQKDNGDYLLYFYPESSSAKEMCGVPYEYLNDYAMIVYGAEELGSKEAKSSVRELYNILKQKLYNVDSVLDDIIGDDIVF